MELDERIREMLTPWSSSASIEGRLSGGYRNTLWAVRMGRRRYAARLSTRPEPALEWEFRLLQHLHAAGMIVPEIQLTRDGRTHVDGLVLMSWLEGESPSSDRDWRLVADELSQLHDLTHDWPQRPGFRSSGELLMEDVDGDVRLDLMPAEVVQRVRDAWRTMQDEPMSVVHGDPGASNIRIDTGRAGFIDWDEARVDVSLFDLAALPIVLSLDEERMVRARRAAVAWEVASGWVAEPEYARRRLMELDGDAASGHASASAPP